MKERKNKMDAKKDVQKQFGRSADAYVASEIHGKGKDLQKLIEMADVSGNENLLDVATGGGHTANAFAPFVNSVQALDLTPKMLAAAKKFITENGHQNVTFSEGDAEDLPFLTNTFDYVTCRIAPHHFPNIEKFIAEVYRVLKPGGQLLLDDNVSPEDDAFDQFYNSIEKMRDYSHYRAWKKTEWLRILELQGFEIDEWHRFVKVFEYNSWCSRMQLTIEEKANLNDFILAASDAIKRKFRIEVIDGLTESFQGEALLLKATK